MRFIGLTVKTLRPVLVLTLNIACSARSYYLLRIVDHIFAPLSLNYVMNDVAVDRLLVSACMFVQYTPLYHYAVACLSRIRGIGSALWTTKQSFHPPVAQDAAIKDVP